MAFLKQASLKIEEPDISVNQWLGKGSNVRTAGNKIVEYKKVLADFNPDDYLLTHCTIVASVDVEDAPKEVHFASEKTKNEYSDLLGRKDYFIKPDTSKYMNANGDAWSRELLKKSYKTFIGAENYVEHVQDPSLSKGKILDAVLREVDGGKSLFADILVATHKKHKELVGRIKKGELQTLSMGAIVAFTVCSQCGRVATDETELCHHIKFLKKNSFISEHDGKKRITAELCGHYLYPESNQFIEGSWVETPAFKGAVMRNEVEIDELDKIDFAEKYSSAMNIQTPDLRDSAARIMKAFAIVDQVNSAFGKSAKTEEEVDEVPVEEEEEEEEEADTTEEEADTTEEEADTTEEEADTTEEESQEIEEVPVKEDEGEEAPETEEDAPVDEELSEDLESMGEPVEDEPKVDEKELENDSKQPFNVVKDEVKQKIKDDIKKEILRDLGIDIETKPAPTNIDNVNLNDTLVKASLNRLRKACIIAKEKGFKPLFKQGFTKGEVLGIAKISNKYSINNDIFRIVNDLDTSNHVTFRRFAKKVESKLGRDLTIRERVGLDSLLKDLFL